MNAQLSEVRRKNRPVTMGSLAFVANTPFQVSNGGRPKISPLARPRVSMVAAAPSTDQKVGIIGGGPSGLAAAWFLMKKGYKDVTILEKEEKVGGKCLTVNYTDKEGTTNNYELGAEYITYAYDTLFGFMDEVNEGWVDAGRIQVIKGAGEFIEATEVEPLSKILPAMWKYFTIVWKYRDIVKSPSNAGLGDYPELTQSTRDFIKVNDLDALKGIFLVRQFGYGPFKDFPAIHLLRTVPLPTLYRILMDKLPLVKNLIKRPVAALAKSGTQGLFIKMADSLNEKKKEANLEEPAVLTSKKVNTIVPQDDGTLKVRTEEGTYEFDKVICALPPKFLSRFMKNSLAEDELELLSKTKYHMYWVGCMEPDYNLPRAYYQNVELKNNEPVQFSKRWGNSSIIAYGYNWRDAKEPGDPEYEDELERDLKEYCKDNMMINEYTKLPGGLRWPTYHPHVNIEDFQNGYFDKLEAMQGQNGVYLTGDGMAAESMEYSCRYSKLVVDKFF